MLEQIKQDIDLIEILFYLKKKIRVILFIMAICMAMVLLFLYINKDNIKVIYSLKINQTTPGILVSCDSNNNFACQTTMTEDVIQRITTFFHTSPDVKNREIRLEWSGDKRAYQLLKRKYLACRPLLSNGMRQNIIMAGKFSMRYKRLQQLTVSFIQKWYT